MLGTFHWSFVKVWLKEKHKTLLNKPNKMVLYRAHVLFFWQAIFIVLFPPLLGLYFPKQKFSHEKLFDC